MNDLVRITWRAFAIALWAVTMPAAVSFALAAGKASPDDTARFLAGIEPAAGSPLAAFTSDASWREHARYFDRAWEGLEKRQIGPIRAWSESNLKNTKPVLFYMFSGPDFLYADAFFPQAVTIVMAALEPVGPIPEIAEGRRGALLSRLREIRGSLGTLLNYSFFRTHDMRINFGSGRINGTLPILYVFLARSGKTIEDVSLVDLDEEGMPHPPGEAAPAKGVHPAKGVKIVYKDTDAHEHTLYYFSTDLSNGGVKRSGFLKFCDRLGQGDSFLKSASYLLFSGNFTATRDFLLDHSASILQDDSGIPLRSFKAGDWELHPFGHYQGPIGAFPRDYQSQLSGLFRREHPGALAFGIGYRWRPHQSNLLLAVKKNTKAAERELPAPLP